MNRLVIHVDQLTEFKSDICTWVLFRVTGYFFRLRRRPAEFVAGDWIKWRSFIMRKLKKIKKDFQKIWKLSKKVFIFLISKNFVFSILDFEIFFRFQKSCHKKWKNINGNNFWNSKGIWIKISNFWFRTAIDRILPQ